MKLERLKKWEDHGKCRVRKEYTGKVTGIENHNGRNIQVSYNLASNDEIMSIC